jgi:hypothetical protein
MKAKPNPRRLPLRGPAFICYAGCALLSLAAVLAAPAATTSADKPKPVAPAADNAKAPGADSDYRASLVLVEGKSGKGSAFIMQMKGHKYLVTNAHVLAGIRDAHFKPLDNTALKLVQAMIAVGHDIVMLTVLDGGTGIPAADSVETEVAMDDTVVVPGNAGGQGVVNLVKGAIIGIGPDRIEVSAPIEPGSSGSPIIHVNSGKVIGIATYLIEFSDRRSKEKKVRRFGYRLDSVRQWQAIDWGRFYADADRAEKVHKSTLELFEAVHDAVEDVVAGFRRSPQSYESPAIRQAMETFYVTARQNPAGTEQAMKNLFAGLRTASANDLRTAKAAFTYDYFKRQVEDEERARLALTANPKIYTHD